LKPNLQSASTNLWPDLPGFAAEDSSVQLTSPPVPESCDLEPFRTMFHDLIGNICEDELILQLRSEALRLLPCDRVDLAFCTDDFVRIFEKPDGYQSSLVARGKRSSHWTAEQPRLVAEDTAQLLRCKSGLQVPFHIGGRFAGTLSFLNQVPVAYANSQVCLAQRIANSVALVLAKAQQLHPSPEFVPAAEANWRDELLRLVCESPDIHRVLPQVSSLVGSTIRHDRLSISVHDSDQNISLRSASNSDGPRFDRFQLADRDWVPNGTSLIINNLLSHHPAIEPYNFHEKVVAAGYRSFLVTHVWTGDHGLGFVFWSKRLNAFHQRDVLCAQKVAELCAVAESKQFLAPEVGEVRAPASASGRHGDTSRSPKESARTSSRGVHQRSASWSAVLQSAKQVAATETTVLLVGETGTGKEVVARMIHEESGRKSGPFVAVNCAALPDALLESELFGFERGAFTGAYHHKRGQIELAYKGVLFLDEVSEMSLSAQAKLLRVLETREFQPLGGTRPQKAEIRVIAATNRDLRDEIRAGKFRSDLYYRLCVFEIWLPPLRLRQQDILPLAQRFLSEGRHSSLAQTLTISPQAEDALLRYQWPGNVRELRNVIERAAVVCEGNAIEEEDLVLQRAPEDYLSENEIPVVERKMIERVLRECKGNKALAARTLGLSRTQLYVRLRRYF
jgi:transcriptional regulator with GAF, ATPase, and Fis domain